MRFDWRLDENSNIPNSEYLMHSVRNGKVFLKVRFD